MRLPEPKKLPSGNWRIQVLVDGKRVGRTFPTKEEAEYWAAGLKTKIMEENRSPWKMTVGAAVDRYIESKSSILSPSTVLGYKRTKKRMEDIIGVQLNDLTGKDSAVGESAGERPLPKDGGERPRPVERRPERVQALRDAADHAAK